MKSNNRYLYGQPEFDKRYASNFMLVTLIVLLVLTYIYALIGYKDVVEPYMENIRLFGTIEYFLLIFLSLTDIKVKSMLKVAILTLSIVILLVKMTYNYVDLDILGMSVDGYRYLDNGMKYSDNSYLDYVHAIYNQNYNLDDLGYFTLIYLFRGIYPDVIFVVYGIIIFNLFCLYYSSYYLYKLCRHFKLGVIASKLTSILWCASPYLMIVMCNGLKEVIFTSIIIIAVYNFYRYKATKSMLNLFAGLGFAASCLFFRTAIFYMLIAMFVIMLTMTQKNKKLYFIIILIVLFFFQVLIPFIIEEIIGVSLEIIIQASSWRIDRVAAGQGSYAGYLPILAAIFGPFPVLDRAGIYSMEYSQAVFVKDVLGLSFFIGVYDKIKRLDIDYLPMIIYIVFNIFMMITAGVSLDIRYHMTYLPFFFLMAVSYLNKKHFWDWGYIIMLIVIIYLYGTRKVP